MYFLKRLHQQGYSQVDLLTVEALIREIWKQPDVQEVRVNEITYFMVEPFDQPQQSSSSQSSSGRATKKAKFAPLQQEQEFEVFNGIKVFGLKGLSVSELKSCCNYFGVARVSPGTTKSEAQARVCHLEVLAGLMKYQLDVVLDLKSAAFFYKTKLSESLVSSTGWKELKQAAFQFKSSQKSNFQVLIWNNAAGFTESIETLLDASKSFEYLAYYDWELYEQVLRQRLHFVDGSSLQMFLELYTGVFPQNWSPIL
ncbi:hypothetical protein MP228_005117 [Amoeboaphelidium protococcarum]|nr:hypothetical protein MP228_005117 [Amoeboaphelidium protococcarum]